MVEIFLLGVVIVVIVGGILYLIYLILVGDVVNVVDLYVVIGVVWWIVVGIDGVDFCYLMGVVCGYGVSGVLCCDV